MDQTACDPLDRNRKGNVAEAAVVFHAARLGIQVFRPLLEHGRYDLVLEIGGQLLRVQCKWAQRVGDVVVVRLVGSRLTPAGYVRTTYSIDEIDAVAAYCADVDRCFLLPSEFVADRTTLHLRLAATKNGQEAQVHWAQLYEFERLVAAAQSPSLDDEVVVADPDLTAAAEMVIGAHQFRDRFGYYLELANGGTEVNITRFGRPYARLVPTVQSPSARPSRARRVADRRGGTLGIRTCVCTHASDPRR